MFLSIRSGRFGRYFGLEAQANNDSVNNRPWGANK